MLPNLQSYSDTKIQKGYERSLAGESLRHIAKALRIPLRTLARRSKDDGWIEERKARTLATESPNVATVATAIDTAVANSEESAETEPESRTAGMERMLRCQQRITSLLRGAYQRDLEKTMAEAAAAGKLPTRAQVYQLVTLGSNVLTMERKAWQVPEKIETKDTTPTRGDRIRSMTEEEIDRRDADLAERIAEAEGRASAHPQREAPPTRIN